jgi:hypothetical protein
LILRVRLNDLAEGYVASLQVLAQALHRLIGIGAYCIVDHYLQDQVSAAFKIKAEVNAILQAGKKAGAGQALRYAEDTEEEYHHDCNDEDGFPEKVLFHG